MQLSGKGGRSGQHHHPLLDILALSGPGLLGWLLWKSGQVLGLGALLAFLAFAVAGPLYLRRLPPTTKRGRPAQILYWAVVIVASLLLSYWVFSSLGLLAAIAYLVSSLIFVVALVGTLS